MRDEWEGGIVGVLTISAGLLAHSSPSSFAYDRPVHTIIYSFILAAGSLLGIARVYPNLLRAHVGNGSYSAIATKEEDDDETELQEWPEERTEQQSTTYKSLTPGFLKLLLLSSVVALIVRVELFRRIFGATECTTSSLEVFVPLVVAVHDALRFQKKIYTAREDTPDSSIYESAYREVRFYLRSYRWRYIPSAFTFCIGAYYTTHLWSGLPSTYVCPVVNGQGRIVPLMQLAAMFLDGFVVCSFIELSLPGASLGQFNRGRGPLSWASILLAASTFWALTGVILFFVKPEIRDWLMILSGSFRLRWLAAATWQGLLFSSLLISAAYCALHLPPVGLVLLLASIFVLIPALKMLWSSWLPFPPIPARGSIFSFLFMYVAWTSYGRITQSVASRRRTPFARHVFNLLLVTFLIFPGLYRTNKIAFHPIDLLIYEARLEHTTYAKYQTESYSLESAVAQYRRRYNISPPPGFDQWYHYAHNRSCFIIDSYDQIHDDLLPWRAIAPSDIRRWTWELVSNPWNEASGISIRNGVPEVMPNVIPTHRWMLEGIANMIKPFAEYLPDMDIAFNINDEARVAVPYDNVKRLRSEGLKKEQTAATTNGTWSIDRASTWLPVAEEPTTETDLENLSFRQTFYAYGSIGCPPNSPARKKIVNSMAHTCLECAAPHSIGQYVINWTHAADVCHQPDLPHLHGFYLSPAAFKTSKKMQPVFSQSKPHGYNDLLYPSAWNYMDKALYAPSDPIGEPGEEGYDPGHPDPKFPEKKNVLFWRGATSEGVAEGAGRATWRGMVRQRLVHLTNNLTSTVSVFLPSARKDRYEYRLATGKDVETLGLKTDIAIVDRIARCGGVDCDDQEKEFALVNPSDFQDHWQYRYLFDLDGAGFSGRFLPFLQSRSLPFKTALFREWYDERITAWRHFVPQDLRLHNVYSSLAYFAGVNGTWQGKRVFMSAHTREGEMIAEQGREGAEKVLRKEDMEVYFFRLLLEWGRLTDDRRDELGYVYKAGNTSNA